MPIKKYELATLSVPARVPREVSAAKEQLGVAHTTLQGIFDSLHVVRVAARSERDPRGPLREGEVDLLRSALVLAGAGMEAVIKRLAGDALPVLLSRPAKHPDAVRQFRTHISSHLRDRQAPKSWVEAIVSDDPRPEMAKLYVEDLVRGSIQSYGDLAKLRDALGVGVSVIPDSTIQGLSGFLIARNQVAHDLDLRKPQDPGSGKRYRRLPGTVVVQCDEVLALTSSFVVETSNLLKGKASR